MNMKMQIFLVTVFSAMATYGLGSSIYRLIISNPANKTNLEVMLQPIQVDIAVKYQFRFGDVKAVEKIKNIQLYGYTNDIKETDNTPNFARSDRFVYEGSCAISQDLWKHKANFGDLVWVEKLNKFYVIEDTLNIKHTKSIDIFCYEKSEAIKIGGKSDIFLIRLK